MRIIWDISDEDVQRVKAFLRDQEDNGFVRHRIQKNVVGPKPSFSKDRFWQAMVACLLTTQQRSGPNSPISRLISTDPFPLDFATCNACPDAGILVLEKLKASGGIRRSNRVAAECKANLMWLSQHWQEVEDMLAPLASAADPLTERDVARFFGDHLTGFGPKQSRNLLQSLGLTKYEIPLDSRIGKWLSKIGFPVPISSQALSDTNLYEFISDGFQQLCKQCGCYPCVLDAAVFASFDGDGWNNVKVIW
jgi:hypothetical protein